MFKEALFNAIGHLTQSGSLRALIALLIFGSLVSAFVRWRDRGGKRGERRVNRELKRLPEGYYRLFADLYLPTEEGTTQIDHLVVSPFGIFVIETKEMTGFIFGTEREARWTQRLGGRSFPFQNPLRQNFGHMKVVANIVGDDAALVSLVVFAGSARFAKEMPENVLSLSQLLPYITTRQTPVIPNEMAREVVDRIEAAALPNNRKTRASHIAHVKETLRRRSVAVKG